MNYQQIFIALFTIIRREWVRTFRIWAGTLLPPVITTLLYFIIFGRVIGSRIGEMSGFSYPTFIAPGLIMLSVINNSYACSVSAFFSVKFHRDIEEMLITPMPTWTLLTGFMLGGMVRGILVGTIVTLISLFFTHLVLHSWSIILLITLLTSGIFSLAGILNAIYAKTFDHISLIPTFVLTPLTYLGGVFYSISLLPPVWQYIAAANPIVYIIHSFRYALLGTEANYLSFSIAVMVFFFIGMFSFAHFAIKSGLGIRN